MDKELENKDLELNEEDEQNSLDNGNGRDVDITYLPGMYQNWFLDYASYVILERAVPHLLDGLKPVQRRILHSMRRLEDGRYNKVANIIGHTMQFHPHGDASIGDALVQLGQKDLLVDVQGNWGNIHTGDSAAAPRYIEARLSKFALEVVFNPKTTKWKASYDGRNKEPINLPVKFPLLLAQGVEGIAVGLASKILPHNFNELIEASIAFLKNEEFELFPDFPTGGLMDCSKYQDGLRGARIRVRSRISKLDKKTLVISEIPYGKTTGSLIDTIISANDKGKIKIKKIDDNTAENVEIHIELASNVSPDKTIDALYAFTDCEVSISPNSCLITDSHPEFMGVKQILEKSTKNTVILLTTELEIRKGELEDAWHMGSLEKIFIENRIYLLIEECETWECVIKTIDKGLDPWKKQLKRPVTEDDITRLTEIKIKRISKFDAFKAEDIIKSIEAELVEVQNYLDNIIEFAINYFKSLKKKYGKGKERKTEIRSFDNIEATKVVVANEKLYVNYDEGFIGTGLKKDEFLFECSDIDDVIIIRKDGTYVVTKVSPKAFVGKNILYVGLFKKNDSRTIYNIVYRDGRMGNNYMKRFPVKGITRDKEYDLTQGKENSKILYFSANPNGEAEVIRINLKPKPKLKKANFEYDFSELAIKNRNANGNILTKHSVLKISLKEKGVSTLGDRKIWFDASVNRLNADKRGVYLGEFSGNDRIIVITRDGRFRFTNYDLSNHFEDNLLIIEKFNENDVYSVIFYDADQEFYYLKRFQLDGQTNGKMQSMIGENPDSKMILLSKELLPQFKLIFGGKNEDREDESFSAAEFIALKSFKARGKRITTFEVKKFIELDPIEPDPDKIAEFYGEDFNLSNCDQNQDDQDDQDDHEGHEDQEDQEENTKKNPPLAKEDTGGHVDDKPPKQKKIIKPKEDEISKPIDLSNDPKEPIPEKKLEKKPKKDKKQDNSASQMTLEL